MPIKISKLVTILKHLYIRCKSGGLPPFHAHRFIIINTPRMLAIFILLLDRKFTHVHTFIIQIRDFTYTYFSFNQGISPVYIHHSNKGL